MTDEELRDFKRHIWPNAREYKPGEKQEHECMKSNNIPIASFFGWIFHGCWHHYNEWSETKRGYAQVVYQEKQCLKCGRVQHRIVANDGGAQRGGVKPKKPDSLPKPPRGKSGESGT